MTRKIANAMLGFAAGIVTMPLAIFAWPILFAWFAWSNYGWECDRQQWLAFHEWVKDEIEKRNSR
jgi:hypothetical protein